MHKKTNFIIFSITNNINQINLEAVKNSFQENQYYQGRYKICYENR